MCGCLSRGVKLTPREFDEALADLSRELERARVRGHLYVIGGAAMIMAYGRIEATADIDALGVENQAVVQAAARRVAEARGLPQTWLNFDLQFLDLPSPESDQVAQVLFDSPHLVVTGASAEHMLAMKVHACREKDRDDIRLLLQRLRIRSIQEVDRIHNSVFVGWSVPWRNRVTVRELLEELWRDDSANR